MLIKIRPENVFRIEGGNVRESHINTEGTGGRIEKRGR